MQPFSDAEIEFFIETNGRLSAERALALGTEFVRFVESQFAEGQLEAIEIVHLGRGSFRSRLMVILRDPATGPAIALAALALTGANLLKDSDDDSFAAQTAKACIESGAARCGFRTSQDEFLVERSAMPAIAKEQKLAAEGAGPFSGEFSSAFAGAAPQAGTAPQFSQLDPDYEPVDFKATGILVFDGEIPVVRTSESKYQVSVADGKSLPSSDVLTDFHLRGPMTRYGQHYLVQGWVTRDTRTIDKFIGRMIEIHDGRAVVFETVDGARYAPVVPDDTMGWVPLGALVQVKATLDDNLLTIYDWNEVEAVNGSDDDFEEEVPIQSETDEPDLDEYLDAGFEPIVADNPPESIDSASRVSEDGNLGGKRDEAKPVEPAFTSGTIPPTRYEGAAFTGERNMVFHSDDGDRFEIVENTARGQIPTAVPIVILAQHTDIVPSEGFANEAIIVEEWWARDSAPQEMKRTELLDGTFVRTTSGNFLITDRGKTFRLNNMPAGDFRGSISLSGVRSGMTDVEGNAVFDVTDIEEY